MKYITNRIHLPLAFGLIVCSISGQESSDVDNPAENEKPDETTESPRERGRVLQKLNPIASEHQVFGELGSNPGADVDGEGVDYRSNFNNTNPYLVPRSYSGFSISGNYNDLSEESEFGGSVVWGSAWGNDDKWFAKFSATSNASDRIVEHYDAPWSAFNDSSSLGGDYYYLDRPRFSEDYIYTRNNVYKFELHKQLSQSHRVYYKVSYQDYFDNFYRNRLELQFGRGEILEDSVVLGKDGESVVSAVIEGSDDVAGTRRYFGDTDTVRKRQHHTIGGTIDGEVWSVDYSFYYHDWDIESEWFDWNFNDFDIDFLYTINDPYALGYEVLRGPDLLETETARFTSLRIHRTETNDEDLAGRIDLERNLNLMGDGTWIRFGALYREKNRTNKQDREVYGRVVDDPFYLNEVDKSPALGDSIVNSLYWRPTGLDPALGKEFFYTNPDAFTYSEYSSMVESSAQTYDAFESVVSGYALAFGDLSNWSFELGGRYEITETNSLGRVVIPESVDDPEEGGDVARITNPSTGDIQVIKDLSASNSYTDFLPSVELEYRVNDSLRLRAAWFNNLMRPQYYNIVNYRRVSVTTKTVSEGNPDLSPTQIQKARLALLTDSDSLGSFSFELYNIDVKDFFYGAVSYEGVLENGVSVEYAVSRVENGKSGNIYGFEVQWKRGLDFLLFGENATIQVAYTYSDSESEVETRTGESLLLPERSKHLLKLDLMKKIGASTTNISFGYQSKALDDLGESAFRDEYRGNVVSLTFSNRFELNSRSMISISMSGLLNHPERSYYGSEIRVGLNQYSSWLGQLKYDFKL